MHYALLTKQFSELWKIGMITESRDTAAGDVVEIPLPAAGPYGVIFIPDTSGFC